MAKKTMNAREKAREKLLLGLMLFILPAGLRAINIDLGAAIEGFIYCLGLVGLVLLIIGIAGLVKNPKN